MTIFISPLCRFNLIVIFHISFLLITCDYLRLLLLSLLPALIYSDSFSSPTNIKNTDETQEYLVFIFFEICLKAVLQVAIRPSSKLTFLSQPEIIRDLMQMCSKFSSCS